MSSYTIESATKQEREPVIQGSTFHSYLLTFAEVPEQKVQMLQKPETPAPKVGEILEGTIEAGREKDDGTKWPDRFKRMKPQGSGGGGFSPEREAKIVRQHSQEMAIRWLSYLEQGGEQESLLKMWIDWFDADVGRAVPVSQPAQVQPTREPAPKIPRDRAVSILEAAHKVGLAEATDLKPVLLAKLAEVGVTTGLITDLNVDQAENVEAWIAKEKQ